MPQRKSQTGKIPHEGRSQIKTVYLKQAVAKLREQEKANHLHLWLGPTAYSYSIKF